VQGRGDGRLAFEIVARGADVQVGDVLLSSGLGGVFPKGLRIGKVVEVLDPGGSLMQTAIVEPAVDFGRLEQVFVLMRRGPSMDLLYGANTPEHFEREEPGMTETQPASRAAARANNGDAEVPAS